jgi:hypothetical protein
MRKITILLIVFLLLSIVIFESVSADKEKPVLHEGDYWNYDVIMTTSGRNIIGTERYEVKTTESISINEAQYDAHIVNFIANISTVISGTTLLRNIDSINYYRESDFSLMKYVTDDSELGHYEVVYQSPFVGIEWPITFGKSWERKTNITMTNSSGPIKMEQTFQYECIGETDVNTSAGLFTCYIVKNYEKGSESTNYSLWYYSSKVGFEPVLNEYYIDGVLYKSSKLTSFQYTPTPDNQESTPGFELILVLFAVALVLFWQRKRI